MDNIKVEVPDGTLIIEAARQAGIGIPSLCYLKDVQSIGACRVCLVEVEGASTLVASCAMPVTDGMKVKTNTKKVRDARRTVVELLLSEHDGDCQTCNRNNDCELQQIANELGIREIRYAGATPKRSTDTQYSRSCPRYGKVHRLQAMRYGLHSDAGCWGIIPAESRL